MDLPHISINRDSDGRVTVEVEDTELYDFVEDHLIEVCNLEFVGATSSNRGSLCVYTMFFPKDIAIETLQDALQKIDPEEVVRIFKLNNP